LNTILSTLALSNFARVQRVAVHVTVLNSTKMAVIVTTHLVVILIIRVLTSVEGLLSASLPDLLLSQFVEALILTGRFLNDTGQKPL